MKLIIAGSRTFTDYQRLCQVLAPDRHRITQVITGGARGADQLGYRWAWKHTIRHQLFRGFVRDTCREVSQRWLSGKVRFLGQPIVTIFGMQNQ